MALSFILPLLSALALGDAGLTANPPAYFQGQPIAVTTCHTVSGLKQSVNGTLNTLDFLEKNSGDYSTVMQKLNLNFEKEGASSWYEGAVLAGGINGFFINADRLKENAQSTVWLYKNVDGKPSARPTARLASWYTNDGKASDTFPYLKTQLIHIQKCEVTFAN
jgi:hypothetical protein